jgi:hypothetical protein
MSSILTDFEALQLSVALSDRQTVKIRSQRAVWQQKNHTGKVTLLKTLLQHLAEPSATSQGRDIVSVKYKLNEFFSFFLKK